MHPKAKIISFPELNGEAFKKAREDAGLSELELANALCLSAKHIKHIEDNHLAISIFFSPAHRYQVAKKIAAHLNLSHENAFIANKPIISVNDQAAESAPPHHTIGTVDTVEALAMGHLTEDAARENVAIGLLHRQKKKNLLPKRAQELFFASLIIGVGYLLITFGENFGKLKQEPTTEIAQSPVAPEEAVEQTEIPTAEVIPADKKIVSTQMTPNPCEYNKDELHPYVNAAPDKPASYVYLVAKGAGDICVIDSENTVTNMNLDHGSAKTVNGKAPFIVVGKDLSKFDIFYQGGRINSFIPQNRPIKLIPS